MQIIGVFIGSTSMQFHKTCCDQASNLRLLNTLQRESVARDMAIRPRERPIVTQNVSDRANTLRRSGR